MKEKLFQLVTASARSYGLHCKHLRKSSRSSISSLTKPHEILTLSMENRFGLPWQDASEMRWFRSIQIFR